MRVFGMAPTGGGRNSMLLCLPLLLLSHSATLASRFYDCFPEPCADISDQLWACTFDGGCAGCNPDEVCPALCHRCPKHRHGGLLDCDCLGRHQFQDGSNTGNNGNQCDAACHNPTALSPNLAICDDFPLCAGCHSSDVCDKLCELCPYGRYGGLHCDCSTGEIAEKGPCFEECNKDPGQFWLCEHNTGCSGCDPHEVSGYMCTHCPSKANNTFGGLMDSLDCRPEIVANDECYYRTPEVLRREGFMARDWWINIPRILGYANFIKRDIFQPIVGDDTAIASTLYTFDHKRRIFKLNVIFPPLYPEESQTAQVTLTGTKSEMTVVRTCEIVPNVWNCVVKVENLPPDEYIYVVTYQINPNDISTRINYNGLVAAPKPNPYIVVLSCFGYDGKIDKTALSDAVLQAHHKPPDVLVINGDQTYMHGQLAYGFLELVYTIRRITRNVHTIVQLDDHDWGQGNMWGASSSDEDDSGSGFELPVCLINYIQKLMMGANPDVIADPLDNGIESYFGRYNYGDHIVFLILEARKYKHYNGTSLLGDEQEAWLESYCQTTESQTKLNIVLTQTPFADLRTHITKRRGTEGITPAGHNPVVNPDNNGAPVEARNRAMDIFGRCNVGLILAGDQHLGIGVTYQAQGITECTAPAAVNSIFFRLNNNTVGEVHADRFGNEYYLHGAWNVDPSVYTQYPKPELSLDADNATKELRADGYLAVYIHNDTTATCEARTYRNSTRAVWSLSVGLPEKLETPSPTDSPTLPAPSTSPTVQPSDVPSAAPTDMPSAAPTDTPTTTASPTKAPTVRTHSINGDDCSVICPGVLGECMVFGSVPGFTICHRDDSFCATEFGWKWFCETYGSSCGSCP